MPHPLKYYSFNPTDFKQKTTNETSTNLNVPEKFIVPPEQNCEVPHTFETQTKGLRNLAT